MHSGKDRTESRMTRPCNFRALSGSAGFSRHARAGLYEWHWVKQVRRERGQIFCECFYEALKNRLVLDFHELSLAVAHLGLLPLKPTSRVDLLVVRTVSRWHDSSCVPQLVHCLSRQFFL